MPHYRTLRNWIVDNRHGFADRYLHAKQIAAYFYAEQALDEAFNASRDYCINANGHALFDPRNVQRSKLIVDTIKWTVGRMLPRFNGRNLPQDVDLSERGLVRPAPK